MWREMSNKVVSLERVTNLRWKPVGYEKVRAVGYGTPGRFRIRLYATYKGKRWLKKWTCNIRKTELHDLTAKESAVKWVENKHE